MALGILGGILKEIFGFLGVKVVFRYGIVYAVDAIR
jgi:hypothetical protein